jgi:hypothetical protein
MKKLLFLVMGVLLAVATQVNAENETGNISGHNKIEFADQTGDNQTGSKLNLTGLIEFDATTDPGGSFGSELNGNYYISSDKSNTNANAYAQKSVGFSSEGQGLMDINIEGGQTTKGTMPLATAETTTNVSITAREATNNDAGGFFSNSYSSVWQEGSSDGLYVESKNSGALSGYTLEAGSNLPGAKVSFNAITDLTAQSQASNPLGLVESSITYDSSSHNETRSSVKRETMIQSFSRVQGLQFSSRTTFNSTTNP